MTLRTTSRFLFPIMFLSHVLRVSGEPVSSGGEADTAVRSPVFRNYPRTPSIPSLPPTSSTSEMLHTFELQRKANAGDPVAQHELGFRYLFGRGVAADTLRAAYWIGMASSQNLLMARYHLGILLDEGLGVVWNPFDAFRQFQIAGEGGIPHAMYRLGISYIMDLVIAQDLSRARWWLQRAADSNFAPARDVLRRFESYQLSSGENIDSLAFSIEPVPLAAIADSSTDGDAGTFNQRASAALGLPIDLPEYWRLDSTGVQLIIKDAEKGIPEAMIVAGRCHERGIGLPRDLVAASLFYVRAARLEIPLAYRLLWELVHTKEFVSVLVSGAAAGNAAAGCVWPALRSLGFDGALINAGAFLPDSTAVSLLKKSASLGEPHALIELGLLAFRGIWMRADEGLAARYWRKAAQEGSVDGQVRLAIMAVTRPTSDDSLMRAISVLQMSANQGSVLAEVVLGHCYAKGVGVGKNVQQAVGFYRRAARQGSTEATNALRALYDERRPPDGEFDLAH